MDAEQPNENTNFPQIESITAHGVFDTKLMYRVVFTDKTQGWIYSDLLETQLPKLINYWETNPIEMRHEFVQNTNLTIGGLFFGKNMCLTQRIVQGANHTTTGLISPSSGAEIVEISRDKKNVTCVFPDETEITCSIRRAIMLFPTELANYLADNPID